jgi:hypothetical protein
MQQRATGPQVFRISPGPGQHNYRVIHAPILGSGSPDQQPQWWSVRPSGDGRLVWEGHGRRGNVNDVTERGYVVTDLDGRNPVQVPLDDSALPSSSAGIPVLDHVWTSGDRLWFSTTDGGDVGAPHPVTLYSAPLGDPAAARPVARDLRAAVVADAAAVWVDARGHVVVRATSGGDARVVPVPWGTGCASPPASQLETVAGLGYADGRVAVPEDCGQELRTVVTDLSGHLVVEVSAPAVVLPALGERSLLFVGMQPGGKSGDTYLYDLVTGRLVRLGSGYDDQGGTLPPSGRFVLWADDKGGHVAELTD